jgi:hypothetical protein
MKILFTRAGEMFEQYISAVNHQSALEYHDGHDSLGPYSILCVFEKKDKQQGQLMNNNDLGSGNLGCIAYFTDNI